jgi:two-component system sensor histidine kinase TctE
LTEGQRITSIRQQLLIRLLIPLCVLSAISSFIAYELTVGYANEAFDRELLSAAHNIAARLTENEEGIVADLPKAVQAVIRHDDQDAVFYQVLSRNNDRLAGDTLLPMPNTPDAEEATFRDAHVNGKPVRIVRIHAQVQNTDRIVVVQVARTLHARSELVAHIFWSIVVPQIALIILTVVVVFVGVQKGLEPLRDLRRDIQARSQLDLTALDATSAPVELLPLIGSLNSLLARLSIYIDAQQRFVANAAHQLRTPVAGLKAYIEYGRRVDNSKIKEVLDQLDNGTDRISEMVAGLLILARASDSHVPRKDKIDLNGLASEVCSTLMREAANKQIELKFVATERPATACGDATELRELLTNIVENAVRYTQAGGKVAVAIAANSPVSLTVSDNGPGIPEPERDRVFERFYRVLGTKVNGSGLGLAIVQEIAASHNAHVEIGEGLEGRGTSVKVTFPPN